MLKKIELSTFGQVARIKALTATTYPKVLKFWSLSIFGSQLSTFGLTCRLTIVREAYREIKDLVPDEEARQLTAREFELSPEDWRVIESHGETGLRAV